MARRKKKVVPIEGEPPEQAEIDNATRPIKMTITEKDIQNGVPLDPTKCAAAQAIMRTLGKPAKVHRGVTYVKDNGGWKRYRTSAALRLETIVYDRGGEFVPGDYILQLVPTSILTKTKKRKSPSAPRTRTESDLATRRRTIPAVRKSARFRPEGDE